MSPETAERIELMAHYRHRVNAGLTTYERRLLGDHHARHRIHLTGDGSEGREFQGGCSCGWTSQAHRTYVAFHNEEVAAHEAEFLAVVRQMM